MEVFAILLSVPAAFVASVVYCFLLAKIVVRFDTVSRWMWWASAVVLIGFAVEVLLLVTLGAVRVRTIIGPVFYLAHLLVFVLGTPALANVLILRSRPVLRSRWYWAIPCCTVFALVLVLLQYSVSESLYGIDGVDGPFSRGFVTRVTLTENA